MRQIGTFWDPARDPGDSRASLSSRATSLAERLEKGRGDQDHLHGSRQPATNEVTPADFQAVGFQSLSADDVFIWG